MTPRRASLVFWCAVGVATLIGLALRLQDLRREPLWFDEIVQIQWTDVSLVAFLRDTFERVAPPLSELIGYAWNNALRALTPPLGADEVALRMPVVACGVATIPVVAATARAAFGPAPGVVAALLLAVNPYHVHYSQEARHYALHVLIVAVAMAVLVRFLRDDGGPRRTTAFGLLLAACVYTNFTALLLVLAAFTATLFARWRTREPRYGSLLRAELLAVALVVPYLAAQLFVQAHGPGMYMYLHKLDPPTLGSLLDTGRRYSVFFFDLTPALGALEAWILKGSIAALAALLILGAVRARTTDPAGLRLHLVATAFAPPLALLAASIFRPAYQDRYLAFILPPLVLLAARARPIWLAAALAVLPVVAGAVVVPSHRANFRRAELREAMEMVAADCRAGDSLAMGRGQHFVFSFYVRRRGTPDAPIAALSSRIAAESSYLMQEPDAPDNARVLDAPLTPGARQYVIESDDLWGVVSPRAAVNPQHWHKLYEQSPLPFIRVWRRDE